MREQDRTTVRTHPHTGSLGRWAIAAAMAALLLTPATGLAEGTSKSQWLDRMETALPTAFCSEQQYFRQCFEVDAKTCERTAASAARSCIQQIESDLPEEVNRNNAQKWGERLGKCAGRAYENTLKDKRIDSERCNNPANWR